MIRLLNGYYIKAEDIGYSLCHGEPTKGTRKDGTTRYRYNVKGYYGTVAQAIEACRRELVHDYVSNAEDSLWQAVAAIRTISNDVTEALKDVDV